MKFATSTNYGQELCELFGLDPSQTTELSFYVQPNSILTMRAEIYLSKEQARQAMAITKRYRMEPLANGEP